MFSQNTVWSKAWSHKASVVSRWSIEYNFCTPLELLVKYLVIKAFLHGLYTSFLLSQLLNYLQEYIVPPLAISNMQALEAVFKESCENGLIPGAVLATINSTGICQCKKALVFNLWKEVIIHPLHQAVPRLWLLILR